jgi:hypothetical protein
MFEYGDSFPKFLRRIGQSVASDYLADVAELEAARTRAHHAGDAAPVPRDAFAAIAPEDLPQLRLKLHPSIVLLESRFPAVSIWEANHFENDNMLDTWKAECALVSRPSLQVQVRALSASTHAFIAALAEGRALGTAIVKAFEGNPNFDLGDAFNTLIGAEIVVGLELPECCTNAHNKLK